MPHRRWVALFVAVALTACGGGSSPPPADDPPPAPAPGSPPPPPPPPAGPAAMLGDCPSFPSTAVFNTRIDDPLLFPAHAMSAAWVGAVGATRALHADWGRSEDPTPNSGYYGIPVNFLDASAPETDWPAMGFNPNDAAPDESDCAVAGANGHDIVRDCTSRPASSWRFPFPRDANLKIEGGNCNDPQTCGDRHVLIVEQGACRLWESYFSYKISGQWTAYSTAAWDLRSNAMRSDSWTSGDAGGLPIAPLLVRASEASAGQISHALRVTFRDSVIARSYVWPARHRAGGDTPNGIPFGALLRLRADAPIPASWTTQAKAIARAMQQYGLYVADIGSDLYVQGDPNVQWEAGTISQIQTLRMNQFEFVDTGSITRDPRFSVNSFAGSW